jgi:hypothetical protein
MKRTSTRRLHLSRQTLQPLAREGLGVAQGGLPTTIPITIPDSYFCPPRSFVMTDCSICHSLVC